MPVLNSRPSASATLVLDFNGDVQYDYGSPGNTVTTPVYDVDGDPTTYSDAELAYIRQMWQIVAEDYAPYNINVTTVDTGNLDDYVTQKVAIGGDGAWAGGGGGISGCPAFNNPGIRNISFVFAQGGSGWWGNTASHESGHAFGLWHQQDWDPVTNTIIAQYDFGPIMGGGNSLDFTRWSDGSDFNSRTGGAFMHQDDMSVIGSINLNTSTGAGFTFASDRAGNVKEAAAVLMTNGGTVNQQGIINFPSAEQDYYRFTTSGGTVSFNFNPTFAATGNGQTDANVRPTLELRDSNGNLVTSVTSVGMTATLSAGSLAAGDYYLVVKGGGSYAECGSYTITGSVPGAVNSVTWDGDTGTGGMQEGSGTWNTTDTNRWYNGSSYQTWSNASPVNAVFGQDMVSGSTAYTVTLGSNITAKSVTFNEGGAYTLSGNTLTLAANGQIINNYKGSISSNITLSGAGAICNNWGQLSTDKFSISGAINNGGYLLTVGGQKNTEISGVISGSGGLNKVESGTLNITTTPTYTGTTTIAGGSLHVSGGIPSSNLVLGGGVLQIESNFARSLGTGANQVQFTSGSTPTGFSAYNSSVNVNINNDSSTLTWGSTNFNPTGGLVLNDDSATNLISLNNGLDMAGAQRTIYVGGSTAYLYGTVGGAAGSGINKKGAGSLVMWYGNNLSGAITVTAGTLDLNNNNLTASSVYMGGDAYGTSSTLNLGTGTLTLNGNFTYSAWANNGGTFTAGGINLSAGDHTFTIEPGPTFTFNPGTISGPGNLIVNSWGSMTLGNNSYTGTTALTHTTVAMSSANAFGTTGAGTTLDGASVVGLYSTAENFTVLSDSTFGSYGGNPNLSGNIVVNSGATATMNTGGGNPTWISGVMSGAGNFAWYGGGGGSWPDVASYLTGSSPNTLSGTFTLVQGTLCLSKSASVDAIAGNVTVGAGTNNRTILLLGNNEQINNASVMTLKNCTTYNDGDGKSYFRMAGYNETIAGLNSYAAGDGVVENTAASSTSTLTISPANGNSYNYSGLIRDGSAGTVALTKSGLGTQVLSGSNTFTGGLTVANGTLSVGTFNDSGSAGPLGQSANPISLGGSGATGTLQYTGGTTSSNRSLTLATGGTGAIDVSSGATTLTISSGINGSGNFDKKGAGTLVLSGANTYGGTTTIDGGTLQFPYNTCVPAGDISIASGASLAVGDSNVGGWEVLPNNISGAGKFVRLQDNHNGEVWLKGNNTYTGGTDVYDMLMGSTNSIKGPVVLKNSDSYSGRMFLNQGNVTGSIGDISGVGVLWIWNYDNPSSTARAILTGTNSYSGGTMIYMGALEATSSSLQGNVVLGSTTYSGYNASLIFNQSTSSTYSGIISSEYGGVSVSKEGTGTAALTGSNTYTVPTTITGGAIRANSGAGLPTNSNLVLSGGVLEGSGVVTFSRALGTGAGQVQWAGDGGFSANGGKLTVTMSGAPNPLVWGSTASFVAAGNTLVFGSATADSEVEFTHAINLNSAVRTVRVDDNTGSAGDFAKLSGVLSSTGGLTKTGAGQLNLTGNNTFTGALTVAGGKLSVGTFNATSAAGPLGQCASATVLGSSGTTGILQYTGGTVSSTRTFTTATGGTGGLDVSSAGTILTDSGVIGGSGGLTKFGAGTLTLSGANTFTGVLTVAAGTLSTATMNATNVAGPLGECTNPTVLGSSGTTGTLQFTGGTVSSARTFTTATGGTGAFDVSTAGTTLTISGIINGSGGLTKVGVGTLILSGANTNTGPVTVSAGILQAGRANAFGSPGSPAVTVGSGATLRINGYNQNLSSIAGSGSINNNSTTAGALVTVSGSDTATFSGVLADGSSKTFGLFRSGTGRQTLTGVNTYTGPTTVSAGTLVLGGSGSINSTSGITLSGGTLLNDSSVALNRTVTFTSGTIGGTGTFTGNMSPGAVHIAPGDGGAGTFKITGALTMASTSVLDFDLSTIGGSNDLLTMTGALTLDGTINVTAPGGVLGGGTYTLISGFTSLTNNTLNFGTMPGGHGYSLTYDSSHVYLTAAPEPATLALLALGGLAMLRRRRK